MRLTNLSTTAIDRGLVKSLQESVKTFKFNDKVVDHFALIKNRRIDFIYKQYIAVNIYILLL